MEAAHNCHFSLYDFITRLAVLLSEDERAQAQAAPTAAAAAVFSPVPVAKIRTQIYESLLRGNPSAGYGDRPCPRLDKLPQCQKLLDEQRGSLDPGMANDIAYCLLNISTFQQKANQTNDSIVHSLGAAKHKLLWPTPLRLQAHPSDGELLQQSNWESPLLEPKLFKFIEDMRGSLQQSDIRRQSNSVLSDVEALRNAIHKKQKTHLLSPFEKSMQRIKDSKSGAQPERSPDTSSLPHISRQSESVLSDVEALRNDIHKKHKTPLLNPLENSMQRIKDSKSGAQPKRLPDTSSLPNIHRQSASVLKDVEALRNVILKNHKNHLLTPFLEDSIRRIKESMSGTQPERLPDSSSLPNKPTAAKKDGDAKENDERKKRNHERKAPKKNFLSDLPDVSNLFKSHPVPLDFIGLDDLIDDLKKVAAGLQSETFLCTADHLFKLRANTTLETVVPEVLDDFVQPFLESGKAYRRLLDRAQWQHTPNRIERPLNRTMRLAISVFLSNSRLFLMSQPANNLSELLQCTLPTMNLHQQLEQMFRVKHSPNISEGTTGACLLAIVWTAFQGSVNDEYSQLLVYLLRTLCETYYEQLYRWLYLGELEEPFNDLFISSCAQRSVNERSKEFFERGYHVRTDAVPGFLVGCEQAILQCGKYNRLLKTYRPQHMLFTLKHPELVVCLSEQELTEVRKKLDLHYSRLLQHIKPFRMQRMFEEHNARSQYGNRMWECTQAHIAAWEVNQRDLLLKANAIKQRRYDELNEQQQEQQQLRLDQQRQAIVYELEYQRKCDKLEEQRLLRRKQAMVEQIVTLQKTTIPISVTDVAISPVESTCSSRSFVTCCDELDVEELTTPQLCQSDVLNFNDCGMEMSRNRMRNMSSEQFTNSQTLVQLHQTAVSNATSSEAKCIRLRVLNCTEEPAQLPQDINMNLEDLSEFQRNRKRMQDHNKFDSYNNIEDVNSERVKRQILSDTELARNRRHVMEKEFYLPLDTHKLAVEPPQNIATPMSTTSDADVEVEVPSAIPTEASDAANNNANNDNSDHDDPFKPFVSVDNVPKKSSMGWSAPFLSLPTKKIETTQIQPTIGDNPFMIKRYMQLSIMVPLNAHLSLLSNEVLRVFHELSIYEHFRQLRNYFFLLDGEFGTLLIDGILERIEAGMQPRSLCQRGVLDSILNNAISNKTADSSSANANAKLTLADKLTLNCTNIPDSFDLMNINVLSILTLNCKVDWPLNLVISVETMAKYAQVFSHLLKLRHVSYMLERAFQHLNQLGKLHGRAIQGATQYRHLQMVRHKLSHFVITLQNHLHTNTLQNTWKTFNNDLRSVDSVEALYQRHVDYLKQVVFLSLLNRQSNKFRETIYNVLVIVLRFCKVLHSQAFVLDEEGNFVHPRYKRLMLEEAEFEKFVTYVIYLGKKIAASGYQEKMVDLIRILNFNNYYNVSDRSN